LGHDGGVTETLSIKVPKNLKARLQATARSRHTTASALLREALEQIVEDKAAIARRPGLLTKHRHLFENLDKGPGDLSVNPEHFEGFGR
jgi:succinate dehydrogenase/fumarate reductase flavoprotein subunit